MNKRSLLILGVYRPHIGTVENFTTAVGRMLSHPIIRGSYLSIVAGDMNINLCDSSNSSINLYETCLSSFNFFPTITKPTRFQLHNQPSNLDHIWVNSLNPLVSGVLNLDLTDHCPTFLLFNFNSDKPVNSDIVYSFRPFSQQNMDKFFVKLRNINWDVTLDGKNVNDMYVTFINTLNGIYCKCFPLKSKKITRKRLLKPWLNPYLLNLIKQKSEYYKLYKLGIISHENNSRFRNSVNYNIRKAKKDYYMNIFDIYKTNIRKNWSKIYELMGKSNARTSIKSLNIDGVTLGWSEMGGF